MIKPIIGNILICENCRRRCLVKVESKLKKATASYIVKILFLFLEDLPFPKKVGDTCIAVYYHFFSEPTPEELLNI